MRVRVYQSQQKIHTTGETTPTRCSHWPLRRCHKKRPAAQRGHVMCSSLASASATKTTNILSSSDDFAVRC